MKMCSWKLKEKTLEKVKVVGITAAVMLIAIMVQAQSGKDGIDKANTEIRTYFESGTKLMYAVGALLGLIGAVKVYQKWNQGDQDTSKVAAAWFGSCIFLVIVTTIIKAFFKV